MIIQMAFTRFNSVLPSYHAYPFATCKLLKYYPFTTPSPMAGGSKGVAKRSTKNEPRMNMNWYNNHPKPSKITTKNLKKG
jgi:hypothetical protein